MTVDDLQAILEELNSFDWTDPYFHGQAAFYVVSMLAPTQLAKAETAVAKLKNMANLVRKPNFAAWVERLEARIAKGGTLASKLTGGLKSIYEDLIRAGYKIIDNGVEIIFKNADDLPIAKISDDALHVKIPDSHGSGGWAKQANTRDAVDVYNSISKERIVYKVGTRNISETIGSQYWSPENPMNFSNIKDYAEKYGVPLDRLVGNDKFIIVGKIKNNGVFITRPAVPYGGSKGGGIEIVCSPESVQFESFHTLEIK